MERPRPPGWQRPEREPLLLPRVTDAGQPHLENGGTCLPPGPCRHHSRSCLAFGRLHPCHPLAGSARLLFLFPASAPSPVGMASGAGVTPALDPRPRAPCQLTSAGTCPSRRRCRAAGLGPVRGRRHSARRPLRKLLPQARPQLPALVLPRSGPSPGLAASPQLQGPRRGWQSPVTFPPASHVGGFCRRGGRSESAWGS